jgi:hypothetical protein
MGFLKPLRFLGLGGAAEPEPSAAGGTIRDRKAKRYDLTGTKMNLLVDSNLYTLHLKDLSACGLCGLTDAPLAPEQVVCLYLTKNDPVALQIRWIRRALIGASFLENVPEATMQKLLRLYKPVK